MRKGDFQLLKIKDSVLILSHFTNCYSQGVSTHTVKYLNSLFNTSIPMFAFSFP